MYIYCEDKKIVDEVYTPSPPLLKAYLRNRIEFKEMCICHKLWFSNSFLFATQRRRP